MSPACSLRWFTSSCPESMDCAVPMDTSTAQGRPSSWGLAKERKASAPACCGLLFFLDFSSVGKHIGSCLEMNNNLPGFHHPSGSTVHKEHLTLRRENGSQPSAPSLETANHFRNGDLERSRDVSAQTHRCCREEQKPRLTLSVPAACVRSITVCMRGLFNSNSK